MTGIDTNLMLDVLVASSPFHKAAREGIENRSDGLCTTPTNIGECLRLLTHPRVFPSSANIKQAVSALDSFLDHFSVTVLEEDTEWWRQLEEVEGDIPGLRGNEIFDARIALCLRANGVKQIYTRDADFKKYSFLRVIAWKKT